MKIINFGKYEKYAKKSLNSLKVLFQNLLFKTTENRNFKERLRDSICIVALSAARRMLLFCVSCSFFLFLSIPNP